MPISWRQYKTKGLHDEALSAPSRPRTVARALTRHFSSLGADELASIRNGAELAIKEQGISFRVYVTRLVLINEDAFFIFIE